jgi:hypothetical protein
VTPTEDIQDDTPVDTPEDETNETPTNITISGGFLPAQGETRLVLAYFTDNMISDGYINDEGTVIINHRRDSDDEVKIFHTLRLSIPDTPGNTEIPLGRKFDNEPILLKIDVNGNLQFRTAVTNNPNDPGEPYIPIGSVGEFELINTPANLSGKYWQTHSLNMLGPQEGLFEEELLRDWEPVGNSTNKFTGIFDGGSKEIRNLRIIKESDNHIGLFGYVNNATLKNIAIATGNVEGMSYVGGIVGTAQSSEISGCYNMGDITASSYAGGVVGQAMTSVITDCSNTGNITASSYAGDVVGGYAD